MYYYCLCPTEDLQKVKEWFLTKKIYHEVSYYNGKLVHIAYKTTKSIKDEFEDWTNKNLGW